MFEAAKGILVLCAGFGLLTLLHRDSRLIATEIIGRLHLNPSKKYPGIFIEAASRITDSRLWFFAGLAFVYAFFRLVEAYGLWRERSWAEWLALVSGAIYLPIEIYEVWEKFTWVRVTALMANVIVVIFMGMVLWRSVQARERLREAAAAAKTAPTAENSKNK